MDRFASSLAHKSDVSAFPLPIHFLKCFKEVPLSNFHFSREMALEKMILQACNDRGKLSDGKILRM